MVPQVILEEANELRRREIENSEAGRSARSLKQRLFGFLSSAEETNGGIEFRNVSTGDDLGEVIEILLDRKVLAAIRLEQSGLTVYAGQAVPLGYDDFLSALAEAAAHVVKGAAQEIGRASKSTTEAESLSRLEGTRSELREVYERARQAYQKSVAAYCAGSYPDGSDFEEIGNTFIEAASALKDGELTRARELLDKANAGLNSLKG